MRLLFTGSFSFTVETYPSIVGNPLSVNPVVGQPYSSQCQGTGGVPPYSNWSDNALDASGQPTGPHTLPAGLAINPTTGVISGTPLTAGSGTVQISAIDSTP